MSNTQKHIEELADMHDEKIVVLVKDDKTIHRTDITIKETLELLKEGYIALPF